MVAVWAVHTEHIGIAHAYPRLNMKARYETAADESYSEPPGWHQFKSLLHSFTCPICFRISYQVESVGELPSRFSRCEIYNAKRLRPPAQGLPLRLPWGNKNCSCYRNAVAPVDRISLKRMTQPRCG